MLYGCESFPKNLNANKSAEAQITDNLRHWVRHREANADKEIHSGVQPVFKHQAGNAGEFVRVVGDEDSARCPGDRCNPEVGLADERACLFERAADINVVFHCLGVGPK